MILSDETKRINHVKKKKKITTAIHSKWEGVCKIYGFLPRFYLHCSQNLWGKKPLTFDTWGLRLAPLKPGSDSAPPLASLINVSALSKEPLAGFIIATLARSDVIPQEIHWKTVLSKVCEIKCEGKSSVQNSSNRHFFFFFLLYCLNIHINKLFPG